MSKLRNPTIEKLVGECKIHSMPDPTPQSKYKEMYYKQKMFECGNYKAGNYSRKIVLN